MDQSVTSIQFFVENFLPSFVPSLQNSPDRILSILFAFEAFKVYIKMRNLFLSPNRILYSESLLNNIIVQDSVSPDQLSKFSFEELDLNFVAKNKKNMKLSIQLIKDSLKKITSFQKFFSAARSKFDFNENPFARIEQLRRSGKKISISVPFRLKATNKGKFRYVSNQGPRKTYFLALLSEAIFIIRPLLYCFFLKFFGYKSWKPLLLNLLIDIIWIVLHCLFNCISKSQDQQIV
jgi:hypothetical protein